MIKHSLFIALLFLSLPAWAMSVYVKLPSGKTLTLAVEGTYAIQSLKQQIADSTGIKTECQRLVYEGKTLQDNRTLADYNVRNTATLHMRVNDVLFKYALADTGLLAGSLFSLKIEDSLFTNVPDTLRATRSNGSALPAWLVFDAVSRTFTGTPGQADSLQVVLLAGNGCNTDGLAADTFNIVVKYALGNAPVHHLPLRIYPNPAGERLFVSPDVPGMKTYRVFNAQGAMVASGFVTNGEIPLAELRDGIYSLQIQYGSHTLNSRFIKWQHR